MDKVASFYEQAFELRELKRHHHEDGSLRSVWLDLGGSILMVEETQETRPLTHGVGAGPFLLAFRVREESRAGWEERLTQLGASIESRTQYSSYVRDPEGNRVAISHYEV